jgi:hypothetical protein
MRAEVLGELVLDRLADLLEAALVDVPNDLDADLLELGQRLVLQLEGDGPLFLADLVRCRLHPALLLVAQAAPYLVADPRHNRCSWADRRRRKTRVFARLRESTTATAPGRAEFLAFPTDIERPTCTLLRYGRRPLIAPTPGAGSPGVQSSLQQGFCGASCRDVGSSSRRTSRDRSGARVGWPCSPSPRRPA